MRSQLVEAAARRLAEHGRDGLTVRSLAGDVGASTQVVYTHFDGLDDLLAEVWREGYRRFAVALDAPAITDDPVADFIEQGWRYRHFARTQPAPLPGDVRRGPRPGPRRSRRGRRGGGGHVRAAARPHRAVRRRRAVGRRRRLDGRRRHLGDGARARAHRAARLLRVPRALAARHLRAGAAGARRGHGRRARSGSRRRSPPVGSGPRRPGCSEPQN